MGLHEFNLTSHGVVTGNSLVVIASAKLKWKILWDCHLNHSTSTSIKLDILYATIFYYVDNSAMIMTTYITPSNRARWCVTKTASIGKATP